MERDGRTGYKLEVTMEQLIKEALQKLTLATRALKEIRDNEGKVCDNFMQCNHRACRSSYGSWYLANEALKAINIR